MFDAYFIKTFLKDKACIVYTSSHSGTADGYLLFLLHWGFLFYFISI